MQRPDSCDQRLQRGRLAEQRALRTERKHQVRSWPVWLDLSWGGRGCPTGILTFSFIFGLVPVAVSAGFYEALMTIQFQGPYLSRLLLHRWHVHLFMYIVAGVGGVHAEGRRLTSGGYHLFGNYFFCPA